MHFLLFDYIGLFRIVVVGRIGEFDGSWLVLRGLVEMVVKVVVGEELLIKATCLMGRVLLVGWRVWTRWLTHIILLYLDRNWR